MTSFVRHQCRDHSHQRRRAWRRRRRRSRPLMHRRLIPPRTGSWPSKARFRLLAAREAASCDACKSGIRGRGGGAVSAAKEPALGRHGRRHCSIALDVFQPGVGHVWENLSDFPRRPRGIDTTLVTATRDNLSIDSDLLDIRVDIRVDNCAVGATECGSAQIDAGQAQARTHMRAAQRSSFYTAHQGAQDRAMEHSLTPGRHLTRRWRSIRRASLLQLQRP